MTHIMLDGVGHVENSESRSHDQHSGDWFVDNCVTIWYSGDTFPQSI